MRTHSTLLSHLSSLLMHLPKKKSTCKSEAPVHHLYIMYKQLVSGWLGVRGSIVWKEAVLMMNVRFQHFYHKAVSHQLKKNLWVCFFGGEKNPCNSKHFSGLPTYLPFKKDLPSVTVNRRLSRRPDVGVTNKLFLRVGDGWRSCSSFNPLPDC